MRRIACATVLALAAFARPHRLDEYLQLTAISLGSDHIGLKLMLTPGVAVAKRMLARIDANGDGRFSEAEKKAYGVRVVKDLVIQVDGKPAQPRILTYRFPSADSIRQGVGEIDLELIAPIARRIGEHRLVFENRHERPIAAYLVECFAPSDPTLRVAGQRRSPEQARYELRYVQSRPRV